MRQFKRKLILSHFVLIILPIVILAFRFYHSGLQTVSDQARSNVYEIVRKSNEIIDEKLSKIGENSASMIIDEDIYHMFSTIDPANPLALVTMDNEIRPVINRYFLSYPEVHSADIVTSYYSFGPSQRYIPQDALHRSLLYKKAVEANGKLHWIPSYNAAEMYGLDESVNANFGHRDIFSAVRLIHSTKVRKGQFESLAPDVEVPVLIVNFPSDLYRKVFLPSTETAGAYYMVLSPDGRVVSHQNEELITKVIAPEWLPSVLREGSGTATIRIDGTLSIVCFDTSNVTGWISIVIIPVAGLVSDLVPVIRADTIYLAIAVALLSLIPVYIISGRITRPIKKTLTAIKDVGEGNFDTKITVESNDEFGILANRFNNMNEKIKELIKENYEVKLREKEVEILALNIQMNPHFLNNTLNIVNLLAIENNQDEISKLIVAVCSMLRYTTKNTSETEAFADDFEWLSNYLYIMKNRFDGKFQVETHIDPELGDSKVPKLFLQPFVENAIIHGFSKMRSGGLIRIFGWRENGVRRFCVEDNGRGFQPLEKVEPESSAPSRPSIRGMNIGIENVDKRIKLLYGDEYGVRIDSKPGAGTSVFVTLPE